MYFTNQSFCVIFLVHGAPKTQQSDMNNLKAKRPALTSLKWLVTHNDNLCHVLTYHDETHGFVMKILQMSSSIT